MLAKKFKLPLGAFSKEKKKTLKLSFFTVFYRANNLPYNRVGVTISAKTEKKSTKRHQASRMIFRFARAWPQKGLDIHMVAHPSLFTVSPKEIKSELDRFITSSLS